MPLSSYTCEKEKRKRNNITRSKAFPFLREATQDSHGRATLGLGGSGRLSVPVSLGRRLVLFRCLAVPQPALCRQRLWSVLATWLWHAAQLGALAALPSLPATEVPLAVLTWCGAGGSLVVAGVCQARKEASLLGCRRLLCGFGVVVQSDIFKVLFLAHGRVNGNRRWALEVDALAW
jgi:hypothetical protein